MSKSGKISISYARADDEPFVKQLYEDLTKNGIDVWWDREKMESRGRTFLQELRDAIENSDRVIAVIGPKAVVSQYVQVEWEHALLFSKCVVPILRLGSMDLLPKDMKKLHCPDFRTERPYQEALSELLRILAEPIPPLGSFRTIVPSLPPHFLSCPEEIVSLKEVVLADVQRPTTVTGCKRVTAITGMGGIGKSVLASAFARATDTRRAFADGVIWVSIGQTPTLLFNMRQIGLALGDESKNYVDEQTATAKLPGVLADKSCLLVLDDVWDIQHVTPLIDSIGPRCRIIITTRDRSIATDLEAQEHLIGTLSDERSLLLLANWCNKEPFHLPLEAASVARECGNLSFALALCGAMARDGTPWSDILDALKEADLTFVEKQLPNYPYKDLLKSLKVSVDALEGEDANAFKYYCELAVFPREAIPEAAVVTLWLHTRNLKERDARKVLTKMANKALLKLEGQEGSERSVLLHDLQHDYLRALTIDFRSLHNQLLEAYWEKSKDGWQGGPNDGYYFEHLVYHLIEAERKAEVQGLLQDLNWIQAKLEATNVPALIADYNVYPKEWPEQDKVAAFSNFVKSQANILEQNPELTFQQAINQPDASPVFLSADSLLQKEKVTHPWFKWLNKPQYNDPQILTIQLDIERVNACGCAWSPDGQRVLSVSRNALKIWDANTGQELQYLKTDIMDAVGSCAWSPDGKLLLSASLNGDIKIWDAKTGLVGKILKGHKDNVTCCVWSPKSKRMLSASWDKTLKIWDSVTFQELRTLVGHTDWVYSCAWSPDGQKILSASKDGTLKIWDASTGQELQTLKGHTSPVSSCAWSPDGQRILSTSDVDGTSRLWDGVTGQELQTLREFRCSWAAWSPNGQRILSASIDGIRVLDANTGQVLQKLKKQATSMANFCAWSPDGKRFLSASADAITIWDASLNRELQKPKAHDALVYCCSLSPDGQRVLTASFDKTLRTWDANTGQEQQVLSGHGSGVSFGAWSPDGQRILSFSSYDMIRIWDSNTGKELQPLGYSGTDGSFDWSPDGKRILATSDHEGLGIWDAKTGERLQTLRGDTDRVSACAWSPDGQRILSSFSKTLEIWDVKTSQIVQTLESTDLVTFCAWSPDGQRILTASFDRTLRILDANTGQELQVFREPEENKTIKFCAWSPDGQLFLSASDETVRIWSLSEEKELLALKTHVGFGWCAWFPDGQKIVSPSKSGLTVWDSKTGSTLAVFTCPSIGYVYRDVIVGDGGRKIVAGDNMGTVFILQLHGLELKTPIVHPLHLYRFDEKRVDDAWTVKCHWCGDRFAVTADMGGREIECPQCKGKLCLNPVCNS